MCTFIHFIYIYIHIFAYTDNTPSMYCSLSVYTINRVEHMQSTVSVHGLHFSFISS